MKIALVQMKPKFLDFEYNFEVVKDYYNQTNADVVLFPELCLSGYNFDTKSEVESCALDGNSEIIDYFLEQTKKNGNAIVFGTVFRKNENLYNSQIFIGNNNFVLYNKVNLFNRENLFFSPGNEMKIVDYKGYRFGMAVCFDWFHPEFFRELAKKGSDIILHSANLVMPYCQRANVTRSIENRVYIATSNRIGEERDLKFTGMSQITDPFGNIILKLGENVEGVYEVELDLSISRNKKLNDFNSIF